jgi:Zn-dependent alcohol dehydrogenase
MNKFLAAVLTEHHKPLSLETFDAVTPEKGQVLVKMISAGLCGAQINEIDAVKGQDRYMPHFMGHEGFGQVLELGEGVDKVKVGDYVILHWKKGQGCDCIGGKYFSRLGIVGSGPVTTFTEQTVVAENRITPVEFDKDLINLYPLMGCALSTAYGIVKSDIKVDSSVLITGVGGLGLSLAFWLKVLYNSNIVMIDKYESKRALAELFGAVFYSFEKDPDIFNKLDKANYCIDTTGKVDVISDSFSKVKPHGSLILVGQPVIGEPLVLRNALSIFDNIKIYSSDGGGFVPERDLTDIIEYVKNNIELANKLITHTIELKDINDGFVKMKNGRAGRIVIKY